MVDSAGARADSLAARIGAVARLRGEFILRSGAVASEYFDKYQFESDPRLLAEIADALVALLPPETELLAGLEMGGIPVATALSLRTGIPAVFVRKAAKAHGTKKLAEGPDVAGRFVAVIEDVVTTGGQIVLSTRELREAGATVTTALCVINRSDGTPNGLTTEGIALRALFTSKDLG